MSGFNVDKEAVREEINTSDIRAAAHQSLDDIIDRMEAVEDQTGGEHILEGVCDAGHNHAYRLTFCDFTDEKPCVFCDGTGVDGS